VATIIATPPTAETVVGVVVFALAALAAEFKPVPLDESGERSASLAFVFLLASQVQFGWQYATLSAFVAMGAAQVVSKAPKLRMAFLADLARTVAETGREVPSLRTFLCAGAPIPGPLVEQARQVLGTKIVSAWGMSENGAVTLIELDDDDERAFNTDGHPLPGVELKVADDAGQALPAGESGRLLVRACSNFGGYLRRPHLNGTDADDWFDTGDLARIDAQGYIRITGRSKDVIIRGGENIPVVEIESLLYRHPDIAMAAIVAYPDERLGERACAVVVPKPGHGIDLPSIVQFLKAQKVAIQYIPERLVVRDTMPSTPSGKIQKFKLRDLLRESAA